MTAIQCYVCPMCGSQREEVQAEGDPLSIRCDKRCRLCGARMYNYFVLKAYKNSWTSLMQSQYPTELNEMISKLKQESIPVIALAKRIMRDAKGGDF